METVACVIAFGGMLLILATFGNYVWWGLRLNRILQQKYPSTWAEITTLLGMPGMRNPFRSIPWLVGPDYCGDEEVRRLKKVTLWSTMMVIVAMTVIPGITFVSFIALSFLNRICGGS